MSSGQQMQIPRSRADVLLWLFGLMLFFSLSIYVALHWSNPLVPYLSKGPREAKTEVLKQIAEARKASSSNNSEALTKSVFSGVRENLNIILALHNNASVVKKIGDLEKETARTKKDNDKIQQLLVDLDQEVRIWDWYFWSSVPWRWLEVLSWGWFGTLVYLLTQIYEHYRIVSPMGSGPTSDAREAYFLVNTPRYFVVASRGTLTVFVILLFVSSIRIGGTGIEITPEQISIELLVFLAFTLGVYNRVAAEQLDLIIAAIFSEAWKRTLRKLDVDPPVAKIVYGTTQAFKADPDVRVRWSIQPNTQGMIDSDSGTYTAPTKSTNTQPLSNELDRVVVIATRVDDPTVSSVSIVTLVESA